MHQHQANLAVINFMLLYSPCLLIICIGHIRLRTIPELNDLIKITDTVQVISMAPIGIKVILHQHIQRIGTVEFTAIRRYYLYCIRIGCTIFFTDRLLPQLIQTAVILHPGHSFHILRQNISQHSFKVRLLFPKIHSQILVDISVTVFQYFCKQFFFFLFQRIGGTSVFHVRLLFLYEKFSQIQNSAAITFYSVYQLTDILAKHTNILGILLIKPFDSIRENFSTSDWRKLIRIPYQNKPLNTIPIDAPQQSSKQIQINHRTFIYNDRIYILSFASTLTLKCKVLVQPTITRKIRMDC